jgi:hypothetical protein
MFKTSRELFLITLKGLKTRFSLKLEKQKQKMFAGKGVHILAYLRDFGDAVRLVHFAMNLANIQTKIILVQLSIAVEIIAHRALLILLGKRVGVP